jgi:predicted 3-demethylubiquinone-9 3-methyltransferase (glyoxalase superfamily)
MSTLKKSQKITPFLWFDNQAEEAIKFYTSIFPNAEITQLKKWGEGTPFPADKIHSGTFVLEGVQFCAFDAGPQFQFNPSISFMVNCDTEDEVERLWQKLSEGGNALMPLDKYPFSEKYGWIVDKFGISWQLILSDGTAPQKVMPSLLFVNNNVGRAEEAIHFYTSVFQNADIKSVNYYGAGQEPNKEGTVAFADFELEGQLFAAMDGALDHDFNFNEAISLFVICKDQQEVDYFWNKFTEEGSESQCGWLKDKFGVSWQIVPEFLAEKLADGEPARVGQMFQALMQMQKLEVAVLEEAYNK